MSGVTGGSFQDFRVHLISITSNGSRLDITAVSQPWLDSHIVFIDTLTQGNGREITFDCTAIADKIIDPKMVAEITPLCAQAHDMAKKYWESQRDGAPDSFTDSNGVYWKRAN
jgi:hypothetical protein